MYEQARIVFRAAGDRVGGWMRYEEEELLDTAPAVSEAEVMKSEQRVALVIGNGAYAHAPLRNPANDARAMVQALQGCGFQVVEKLDVDRKEMLRAIREFGELLREGGVGLFYFAGHGIQVKGQNFLVPVGAELQHESEAEEECVLASSVVAKMESAGNRVNILILDACRNSPFASGSRALSGGLAQMDAARGSLVAYATAPGSVAADGAGEHGLYTWALLKYLSAPGLKLEEVFKEVRKEVMRPPGKSRSPGSPLP